MLHVWSMNTRPCLQGLRLSPFNPIGPHSKPTMWIWLLQVRMRHHMPVASVTQELFGGHQQWRRPSRWRRWPFKIGWAVELLNQQTDKEELITAASKVAEAKKILVRPLKNNFLDLKEILANCQTALEGYQGVGSGCFHHGRRTVNLKWQYSTVLTLRSF